MEGQSKMEQYEAVIGLEIHAELATASKMFCSCANDPFAAQPNEHICPICLGFPGTLPVPNKRAIELTLQVGKVLNCQPVQESKFDRKNYFYPDLPKGYQISQYDLPLMEGGSMTVEGKAVRIRRVHLEEDTGKNIHKVGENASLVDYNRAGVPLIELVTEPDITSAREAVAFAKELQLVLRYLKASSADMEKGEMRVEANVSVMQVDELTRKRADESKRSSRQLVNPSTRQLVNPSTRQLGTKVEIKNLNSFRAVEKAIAYELSRQIEILEQGGRIVQETRGWDEDAGQTFSQRTKEEAEDYRYFPEPDIPPLAVADWQTEALELPEERRARYIQEYELQEKDADVLVADKSLADLFEAVTDKVKTMSKKTIGNWIINEGLSESWGIEAVAELLDRVGKGEITAPMAKGAVKKAKETGKLELPKDVQVISDQEQLVSIIDDVLGQHRAAVTDVKAGKSEALGFLVGQVMAKTRGQANPKMVNEILLEKLADK
jgi:aspartyl-tRNA(Asn)/glutamyl-tRNA(Gln) amidotransferase subunit B